MPKLNSVIGLTTCVAALAVATSLISAPASAAVSPSVPSGVTRTAVALANRAGFADISANRLVKSAPANAVPLTPALVVALNPTKSAAFSTKGVTINGKAADGSVTVVRQGGFGVVTDRHANVEYRYKTFMVPGTKLVKATDGGLDQLSRAGQFVGHIDAAYALDSAGTKFPASYSYDSATHELVVRANTTAAKGDVFIDPSWRCWMTAGAYGIGWIVAVAGWVFTDGTAAWAMWALRAWFGVSYNAANVVAKACALH